MASPVELVEGAALRLSTGLWPIFRRRSSSRSSCTSSTMWICFSAGKSDGKSVFYAYAFRLGLGAKAFIYFGAQLWGTVSGGGKDMICFG